MISLQFTEMTSMTRPTAIAGDVGQGYTVYEKPWTCGECRSENFAKRERCLKCKSARPAGAIAVEWSPALEAAANGQQSAWKEAFDVRTRQVYYYNTVTRETSWARPAELGPAPYATGFFGRGAAGSTAQAELEAKNKTWLARPARKQADFEIGKMQRAEGANEYNIWYGKYIGDHWTGGLGKDPAPSRCDPENDCGWTKASRGNLERAYFCIHFARGACARGPECTFYHHIPTAADDGAWDALHDTFGRERHTSHREDMSGVGSFMSDCRTLYVAGIKKNAAVDIEALVRKNFEAWGELEHMNFIPRLSVAFMRYRCRLSAEFALTAMGNQSLGHGEVLNVRWAHDDPNPVAKDARQRADADAVSAALAARGVSVASAFGPLQQSIEDDEHGHGGDDDSEAMAEYKALMQQYEGQPEGQGGTAGSADVPGEEAGASIGAGVGIDATLNAGASEPASANGFSGIDAAAFLSSVLPPPLEDYSSVARSSSTSSAGHAAAGASGGPSAAGVGDAPPVPPTEASDPRSPAYSAWYYSVFAPWAAIQAQAASGATAGAGKRSRTEGEVGEGEAECLNGKSVKKLREVEAGE